MRVSARSIAECPFAAGERTQGRAVWHALVRLGPLGLVWLALAQSVGCGDTRRPVAGAGSGGAAGLAGSSGTAGRQGDGGISGSGGLPSAGGRGTGGTPDQIAPGTGGESSSTGGNAIGTGGRAMAPGGAPGTGGAAGGGSGTCAGSTASNLGVASHQSEGANHLVLCTPTSYATVPPSSGFHYPIWPVYKTYAQPVPWGFLVHGLEHGAVVVVYNCPAGCPAEVAQAQAWIDSLNVADPVCPGEKPRVILVPDPTLDVRWAAAAWTWTLRWCAFDTAIFQQFFTAHYNMASEMICRSSGGADWSSINWCEGV